MDFNQEMLLLIYNKKKEVEEEQKKLNEILKQTAKKIEDNENDIKACEHLLNRCGFVEQTQEEVSEEQQGQIL